MEKKFNSPKDFIGEDASYMGIVSKIKDIREIEGMTLVYFENGIVVNFNIIKNKENQFLEDLIKVVK